MLIKNILGAIVFVVMGIVTLALTGDATALILFTVFFVIPMLFAKVDWFE